jgi:hypothetical protein
MYEYYAGEPNKYSDWLRDGEVDSEFRQWKKFFSSIPRAHCFLLRWYRRFCYCFQGVNQQKRADIYLPGSMHPLPYVSE